MCMGRERAFVCFLSTNPVLEKEEHFVAHRTRALYKPLSTDISKSKGEAVLLHVAHGRSLHFL